MTLSWTIKGGEWSKSKPGRLGSLELSAEILWKWGCLGSNIALDSLETKRKNLAAIGKRTKILPSSRTQSSYYFEDSSFLWRRIFSRTTARTSNLRQYYCQNLKSSAVLLPEPQIFCLTIARTSNLQQHYCQNLKSSAVLLPEPQIFSSTTARTSNLT